MQSPDQLVQPQENAERVNFISSLISKSQEPTEAYQSNTSAVVLSSDSQDSILQLDSKKGRRVAMSFQLTNILESLTKLQWTAATNLMKENLRLKNVRPEKTHSIFETCTRCAEEGVKYDGERKKRLE